MAVVAAPWPIPVPLGTQDPGNFLQSSPARLLTPDLGTWFSCYSGLL